MALVEVEVERWAGEMGDGDDRPLIVAYDLRDLLERIERNMQRGFDSTNSALALKADKADLDRVKSGLHSRIDEVDHELNQRVGAVELAMAGASGWRSGFLVALGVGGGLVVGLVLRLVEVV